MENRGARAAVTGAFRIGKALRPTAESGCGKGNSVSGEQAARDLAHCEKRVFLTSETLGYWEEKLRVRSFLRGHKSFLVNPGQISRIGREMIELEDGSQLPVSRYRYPEVMARYEAWIRHAEFLE